MRLRSLLVSLALGASLLARAENAPKQPAPSPRALSPILAALDADHNGTLSPVEITAAPVRLSALDLNEDGMISPDEWRVHTAERRSAKGRLAAASFNVVLTLDANLDGNIQSLEIANAVSSLKRLDLNGDGQLTPGELRPVLVARAENI